MPGFGKSGTLRIFALSVVVIERRVSCCAGWLRQDAKVVQAAGRRRLVDQHVVPAGSGRATTDAPLETNDGVDLAFGFDFNPAIVEVTYCAVNAFATGDVEGEIAKANTLHPPCHDQSSRDEHEPLIIAATVT